MEICQLSGQLFSPASLRFTHGFRKLDTTQKLFISANGISCYKGKKADPESQNRMFILGMGFVGQYFAQELLNEPWVVSGTCTSMKKNKELEERGFDIQLFDANQPEMSTMDTLKCYTHLLVSIPPVVGIGDPMLQHGELLRSVLMGGNLQWLCYLSSTSVYGDCGGAYVDEDYPTNPTNELAKLSLVVEQDWLNLADDIGIAAQVFRLGGKYILTIEANARMPVAKSSLSLCAIDTIIKQGVLSESQKRRVSKQFTSRVHVADICQALKASICKPSSRRIYNIVDDDPAPREEVFAYASELVQRKWPFLVKETDHPTGKDSFAQREAEKRVVNTRMKKELGVQLLHPSYKSGLKSIIDQMENPF